MGCPNNDPKISSISTLTAASLSVIGSLLVIIIFLFGKKKENEAHLYISKLIFYLSVADFGASLFVSVSSSWLLASYPDVYSFSWCLTFRVFIQYFFISSFFWTSCIAFRLWQEVKYMDDIPYEKITNYSFHIISWGVPALFVMIIIGTKDIQRLPETGWCSDSELFEIIFWFLPLSLSFFWNLFFYVWLIFRVFKLLNRSAHFSEKKNRTWGVKLKLIQKLTFLLLVFLMCWFVDIFVHIRDYISDWCGPQWVYIFQDAGAPFQGAINAIVYGLSHKEFRSQCRSLFFCCSTEHRKGMGDFDPLTSPLDFNQEEESLKSQDYLENQH